MVFITPQTSAITPAPSAIHASTRRLSVSWSPLGRAAPVVEEVWCLGYAYLQFLKWEAAVRIQRGYARVRFFSSP